LEPDRDIHLLFIHKSQNERPNCFDTAQETNSDFILKDFLMIKSSLYNPESHTLKNLPQSKG
jgi:hypothetical protein